MILSDGTKLVLNETSYVVEEKLGKGGFGSVYKVSRRTQAMVVLVVAHVDSASRCSAVLILEKYCQLHSLPYLYMANDSMASMGEGLNHLLAQCLPGV